MLRQPPELSGAALGDALRNVVNLGALREYAAAGAPPAAAAPLAPSAAPAAPAGAQAVANEDQLRAAAARSPTPKEAEEQLKRAMPTWPWETADPEKLAPAIEAAKAAGVREATVAAAEAKLREALEKGGGLGFDLAASAATTPGPRSAASATAPATTLAGPPSPADPPVRRTSGGSLFGSPLGAAVPPSPPRPSPSTPSTPSAAAPAAAATAPLSQHLLRSPATAPSATPPAPLAALAPAVAMSVPVVAAEPPAAALAVPAAVEPAPAEEGGGKRPADASAGDFVRCLIKGSEQTAEVVKRCAPAARPSPPPPLPRSPRQPCASVG